MCEGNWKVRREKENWFLLGNGKVHGGMVKSILKVDKGLIFKNHMEYVTGFEFIRKIIVFHLRNLDQNILEGAMVRVQSDQTFNFWYDEQKIKI